MLSSSEDAALGSPFQTPRPLKKTLRSPNHSELEARTPLEAPVARHPQSTWQMVDVQAKIAKLSQTHECIIKNVSSINNTFSQQNSRMNGMKWQLQDGVKKFFEQVCDMVSTIRGEMTIRNEKARRI